MCVCVCVCVTPNHLCVFVCVRVCACVCLCVSVSDLRGAATTHGLRVDVPTLRGIQKKMLQGGEALKNRFPSMKNNAKRNRVASSATKTVVCLNEPHNA